MRTSSYSDGDPHAIVTAEDYIGTGDDADWGRLCVYRLANHLLHRGSYEPLPFGWVEAVSEFATGLIAKADFPSEVSPS